MRVVLEAHAMESTGQGAALLLGAVAQVVEQMVTPHAEVLEFDPLAAVGMLHAHVPSGTADPVSGTPMMVAGAQVVRPVEVEALAAGLDPTLLTAEPVIAGHRADGPAADDHPGSQLPEDRALGVEPGQVERDAELVRPELESPLAERFDHVESEGAELHVHAIVAQGPVGPDGGVLSVHIDDGEGLGGAEVRVERQPDHDQHRTDLVLTGEPHPFVRLGVGAPHHPHRVGGGVYEELVEARKGCVLVGSRVGRGHEVGRAPKMDSTSAGVAPVADPITWAESRDTTGMRSDPDDRSRRPPKKRESSSVRTAVTSVPPIGRWVHSTLRPCWPTTPSTRGTPPSSSGRTTTRCWAHCGRRRRCTSSRPVCGPSPATGTSGISAATPATSVRVGG